jgi:hypothetical protein
MNTDSNVLAGLTPETAASSIKLAILLAGNTGPQSAFWTETATDLVTATLGLLENWPEHYSLKGLHQAIFNATARRRLKTDTKELLAALQARMAAGGPDADIASDQFARVDAYRQYIASDFPNVDEKVQDGARSQLSQVIQIFNQKPEMSAEFCQSPETVANSIKLAILLAGNTGPQSAFWTNTATDLVTATLGLLENWQDRYSLKGLHQAIVNATARRQLKTDTEELLAALQARMTAGGPDADVASDQFVRVDAYRQYIASDFANFDQKVQDGARSQLSQVIQIFNQKPEMSEAFCQSGEGARGRRVHARFTNALSRPEERLQHEHR